MITSKKYPQEYRIPVSQDHIRSIKAPYWEHLTTIHAFVKIRDLETGNIPDKINPRSHEQIKMKSRVPDAICKSLKDDPRAFHLLNRGCLILAKKAWYDNQLKMLHFIIESEDEYGMVDGATTDRVLAEMKKEISDADFTSLREDEIPEYFKDSYIHLEIIAGEMQSDLRIDLADARNTSEQVKEFSLEDLGDGFDWLKEILEKSELRGRIRYRENEPKSVDVRTVLALLTLFHPNWTDGKDPLVAYTAKGRVIDIYRDSEWRPKYKKLAPVVIDILKLYDHIHVNFQPVYMKAFGGGAKLGKRNEVRYIKDAKRAKVLPLTENTTQHVIPDGWLYPLLGSFRTLLDWPKAGRAEVRWALNPFEYFDKHGSELVKDIVEQSEELGNNPNATGKSRMLWSGLRTKVENHLLKSRQKEYEEAGASTK